MQIKKTYGGVGTLSGCREPNLLGPRWNHTKYFEHPRHVFSDTLKDIHIRKFTARRFVFNVNIGFRNKSKQFLEYKRRINIFT